MVATHEFRDRVRRRVAEEDIVRRVKENARNKERRIVGESFEQEW